MNLQYISDTNGITTAVVIPIQDWDQLKKKYKELETDDTGTNNTIPDWHKSIIDERLASMKNNVDTVVDFYSACDDIEKEL